MNPKKLRKEFKNPGTQYRGSPFWSWNDRLSESELVRQARDMKQHGMGGFFMHSREGLETEYLGKKWMSCIRRVVKEAKKTGMQAWLYDEDRWPSGFAGGLVTQSDQEYQMKGLILNLVNELPSQIEDNILAVFVIKVDKTNLVCCRKIYNCVGASLLAQKKGWTSPPLRDKNEKIAIFKLEVSQPVEWYNGLPPADNLSFESVRKFIETTYAAYYKEVGTEFGKTVPGIFTDEPNIQHGFTPEKPGTRFIPWTTKFVEYFQSRRGYDILDFLPYLFFDGTKTQCIRHDYWHTIAELYCEAYSKQLGTWCEKHKLQFSGHYLSEEHLAGQVHTAGAIMPHYQYQHQPGIDILCESIDEILTVKQCSSVAHQFARKRVLSELYGCTGWEFTFEGQKWVGDWQYALGVNFRCQHLALYTLRGCRKRDYPPSFNYQNTWWTQNPVIEDYFARLSLMLSEGQPIRDILVIHPISTAWTLYNDYGSKNLEFYQQKFYELSKTLLGLHRDFDYGDEMIMKNYGKVVDKKIKINLAEYKLVIIPPAMTLFSNTIKLLKTFMNAGGNVIAIKPVPTLVDAKLSPEIDKLFKYKNMHIITDITKLDNILSKLLAQRISVTDTAGNEVEPIIYQERKDTNGYHYIFLANTDRNNGYTAKIKIETKIKESYVEEWDLLTGEVNPLSYLPLNKGKTKKGYLEFETNFAPVGSKLFVIKSGGTKSKKQLPKPEFNVQSVQFLGPRYKFRRTDFNALPLDFCQYRRDGDWSETLPVWQAQRQIRDNLKMRQIFMNGGIQRWKWVNENPSIPPLSKGDKRGIYTVELRFTFSVKHLPEKPVYLVVEGAKQFSLTLNNKQIDNTPQGWWLDQSFDKVVLPNVTVGKNVLILKCEYRNETELEDCYIIGDFGVSRETKEIIKEPRTLHPGNWTTQGYPFYPGNMVYEVDFPSPLVGEDRGEGIEKIYLTLGEYKGTTATVIVNSNTIPIPWRAADRIEITKFLKPGNNRLEITIYGSLRNLLGPLHDNRGKTKLTGPGEFRTEGDLFTKDYVIHPWGLMGQVRIEVGSNQ